MALTRLRWNVQQIRATGRWLALAPIVRVSRSAWSATEPATDHATHDAAIAHADSMARKATS